LIAILLLASLLLVPGFGKLYILALVVAAGMFIFEHWLVYKSLDNTDAAFFTVNGIFSIVFAALAIADIFI
jgi:4-hydroxybenzoate polyprenyltransferase